MPIHQRSRDKTKTSHENTRRRLRKGKTEIPQRIKRQAPSHLIATAYWISSKPSWWRWPGYWLPLFIYAPTIVCGNGSTIGPFTILSPYTPPHHHRATRPLRTHRSPERYRGTDPKWVIRPSYCSRAMWIWQGDKGRVPNFNGPKCHSGSKCIGRPHHTVGTATISPLLPQYAQHKRATSGLRPDLRRE